MWQIAFRCEMCVVLLEKGSEPTFWWIYQNICVGNFGWISLNWRKYLFGIFFPVEGNLSKSLHCTCVHWVCANKLFLESSFVVESGMSSGLNVQSSVRIHKVHPPWRTICKTSIDLGTGWATKCVFVCCKNTEAPHVFINVVLVISIQMVEVVVWNNNGFDFWMNNKLDCSWTNKTSERELAWISRL